MDAEVVLCCYRAVNAYYYKYAVDGINVFAVSILFGALWEKISHGWNAVLTHQCGLYPVARFK